MSTHRYHKRSIGNHQLHPETQMMSFGYDPMLSEGAVKTPIFLTSTFAFRKAIDGKTFFQQALGKMPTPEEGLGLIYSRFNNPNLEMLEDRLALWEGAGRACVFSSGMSAIATVLLTHVRPGDALIYSAPIYGGTAALIGQRLPEFGISPIPLTNGTDEAAVMAAADAAMKKGRVRMFMLETPANPTNALVDFALIGKAADYIADKQGERPLIACDNTMLGPVFQQPLKHGVDFVIYSLTKYIAGHSDLVAGAVLGNAEPMKAVWGMRGGMGTQLDSHSAWMITRSLETLSLRMEKAANNARKIAEHLRGHPKVEKILYLGFLPDGSRERAVYDRQCTGASSTFAFLVKGGEAEAFKVLDGFSIIKNAVSLGGTESLACHPASTTHAAVPDEERAAQGVSDAMVRVSIGIEHPDDLIADIDQALAQI